jgi:hypothetical protein
MLHATADLLPAPECVTDALSTGKAPEARADAGESLDRWAHRL